MWGTNLTLKMWPNIFCSNNNKHYNVDSIHEFYTLTSNKQSIWVGNLYNRKTMLFLDSRICALKKVLQNCTYTKYTTHELN